MNQPDATPEDAQARNPHFAGSFTVFGGPRAGEPDRDAEHQTSTPRRVMQLFAARENVLGEDISQVTLVATDEAGAIVARDQLPFDAVSIRASVSAEAWRDPADRSADRDARRTGGGANAELLVSGQ